MDRSKLLESCFVNEHKFNPLSLGGKKEITIRELTVFENAEHRKLLDDKNVKDEVAINYAVKCSMVDPIFFSDEELKQLSQQGQFLINEIYMEIPLIGKTKEEREAYFKAIQEHAQNNDESEEDLRKK